MSGSHTFSLTATAEIVLPCPPECNFQSETKIERDLRLSSRGELTPKTTPMT